MRHLLTLMITHLLRKRNKKCTFDFIFIYIFFTKLDDITILLSINVSGRPRRGAMDRNIIYIIFKKYYIYSPQTASNGPLLLSKIILKIYF